MYYYDIATDNICQKVLLQAEKCKKQSLNSKKYIITCISMARHNLLILGMSRPWEQKRNHRSNTLLLHVTTLVEKRSRQLWKTAQLSKVFHNSIQIYSEKQEVTVRNIVMYQKTARFLLLWVDTAIINLLQLVFSVFCFQSMNLTCAQNPNKTFDSWYFIQRIHIIHTALHYLRLVGWQPSNCRQHENAYMRIFTRNV